ncbi:MAG: DUF5007 domain-containing protein [Cyclobacteriaceae bacterium]
MKNIVYTLLAFCTLGIWGCEDSVTEGTLSVDIKYKDKKQTIVTSLGDELGEFLTSKSSLPIKFEIAGVAAENGSSTEPLFAMIEVPIFTQEVTGNETSEALALKTKRVSMPAVSIGEYTGKLIVREGNSIAADKYHFDIKVTNVSGSAILDDALILEVKDFDIIGFSDFQSGVPVIERIADSPNQILFTAYDEDAAVIPAESIDFVARRDRGFKGIFVDDTNNGELWQVDFPVRPADTYVYLNEDERYINFALGKPGSYKITFYK